MSKVTVKSIDDLLTYKFFIPAYQRGYRWTERQVEDLLNDIEKFTPEEIDNSTNKTWYCLQPVVVKGKEEGNKMSFLEGLKDIVNGKDEPEAIVKTKELIKEHEDIQEWEVIDGQQRLTTIFLILTYLSYQKFNIKFATRNDQFLNEVSSLLEQYELNGEIHNDGKAVSNHYNEFVKSHGNYDNIDNFHIFRAYLIIKRWFETHEKDEFREKFLKHVKVIWYETQYDDAIEIFTRINMGKIPLTNAELIKALFLNSSNLKEDDAGKVEQKQLEIASEWDRMEYALQDDAFWYFINKEENNPATRIEFVFDLMYSSSNKNFGSDEYSTFRYFSEKFKDNSDKDTIEKIWKEIKKYYQTLEEWFTDRELYHKIGFLITTGVDIKDILAGRKDRSKKDRSKKEFREFLDLKISPKVDCNLDELAYKNGPVRNVLLLHNIQTILSNENETNRFSFDRYKKEKWDVEHIHAIATEVKVKKEDQKAWLKNNFTEEEKPRDDDHFKKIEEIQMGNPIEDEEFKSIIEYVLGEEDNSIRNLCLLDRGTNRSYKNDSFIAKRAKIIKQEKVGVFIPIATKNVFMKFYSENFKDLDLWNEADRNCYLNDIKATLKKYSPQQPQSTDEQ